MRRIIVTGGSGFVGTNLVEHATTQGQEVLNLDIKPPRNPAHASHWTHADVRDAEGLRRHVESFRPTHILHMAARTDLEGRTLGDYDANTTGVASLIEAATHAPDLEHVVFASSMLVCRLGYMPRDEFDFAPDTVYGESKVAGEKCVRDTVGDRFPWTIVRPTSLWGPWFDIPYKDFFVAVARGRYVHPRGRRIRRSYGFVLNAVRQVEAILSHPDRTRVDGKVFYLADYEPVELREWSKLISQQFGVRPPREVPLALMRALAAGGDVLKRLGMQRVPISTRRLSNLLTEAVYDLRPLENVAGPTPHDLGSAVAITAHWMKTEVSEQ